MGNTAYFISIVGPRTSLPNKSDFSLMPPTSSYYLYLCEHEYFLCFQVMVLVELQH